MAIKISSGGKYIIIYAKGEYPIYTKFVTERAESIEWEMVNKKEVEVAKTAGEWLERRAHDGAV